MYGKSNWMGSFDTRTTATVTRMQITSVWFDECTDSNFDVAGFEEMARRAGLLEEMKQRARAYAPPPRVLVRQPQVMHGRSPLAPLARSSC